MVRYVRVECGAGGEGRVDCGRDWWDKVGQGRVEERKVGTRKFTGSA